MKYEIILVFFIWSSFSFAEDLEPATKIPRKVKGQHYVTDTMVAKVVGAEGLSEDLLRIVQNGDNDTVLSPNSTLVVGAHGPGVPLLVTESVKTSITKISIPLSITFMDSEWYRNTLKKFLLKNKIAISNKTSEQRFSETGTDTNQIIANCFFAATFRENIIMIFGYLLHHPRQVLSEDLYRSLELVMEALKLRKISFMDDLDIVERMAGESIHNQFITLFEVLEKVVSKYIRSSVTYWLECLYHKIIDIDEVLKDLDPNINFLSSFNEQQLMFMSKKMLFPESTVKRSSQSNEELLGKKLSYIVTEVLDQRTVLTPQLFAGMMVHLPSNVLIPEVEESSRFAVELIKHGNADVFASAVSTTKIEALVNPYDLIRTVLISLSEANYLGRKCLFESVALGIDKTIYSYVSSNYQIMQSLISSNQIRNLLLAINPEEYSIETIVSRDKLLRFIDDNKMILNVLDINKYLYQNPVDLLLAVVTRLTFHQNTEIVEAAAYLKSSILLKKVQNNIKFAITVEDIITLLSHYQTINTSPDVEAAAKELKSALRAEKLMVQRELLGHGLQSCRATPDCVFQIINMLVSKRIITNGDIQKKMEEMLRVMSNVQQRRFLRNVDENSIIHKFQVDEMGISSEIKENFDVLEEIT